MGIPNGQQQQKSSDKNPGKMKILGVIGSYVSVFEARAMKGADGKDAGKPKYSLALLIPKTDPQVAKIKAVIEHLAVKKFGAVAKQWCAQPPSIFKYPLRDGDIEKPADPLYKGMYFLNASSVNQPGIVDGKLQKVFEKEHCYSGCTFNVSGNFFAFENVSKGVSYGLNNLQVVKEGPRIDGRTDAADDFADFVDEGATPGEVDPIG